MANQPQRIFKYPSEDEYLVRRLGSAVLKLWRGLPEDVRAKIQSEAANVWDREYGVAQIRNKLEAFIKRHPGGPD